MRYFLLLLFGLFIFSSCEDIIELPVKDAEPKHVIEADLHNRSKEQVIRISKTARLSESETFIGLDDAEVYVQDEKEKRDTFFSVGNGNYINLNFKPMEGERYKLSVRVEGESYEAFSVMPDYVEIDTIGFVEENVFGKEYYFLVLRFQDPEKEANYYKYNMSVNDSEMEFISVNSDKFNDGLYVEHRLTDKKNTLQPGDEVTLIRSTLDAAGFKYWNEYQMTNPASASPGNPTSNISNGALGYFIVRNAKSYKLNVPLFTADQN